MRIMERMNVTTRNLIKLSASSDYNTAGKQYIARVTGISSKWGLALDFVGTRSGKRNDATTATITVPGVYVERDTTRKGTTDTYYLVWRDGDGLTHQDITQDQAAALAGQMDAGSVDYTAAGRADMIEWHERMLAENADKDPDEEVKMAAAFKLLPEGMHKRGAVMAARRAEVARLRGETPSDRPLDLDGGPTDQRAARRLLETERAQLVARLAEIDAELASN